MSDRPGAYVIPTGVRIPVYWNLRVQMFEIQIPPKTLSDAQRFSLKMRSDGIRDLAERVIVFSGRSLGVIYTAASVIEGVMSGSIELRELEG